MSNDKENADSRAIVPSSKRFKRAEKTHDGDINGARTEILFEVRRVLKKYLWKGSCGKSAGAFRYPPVFDENDFTVRVAGTELRLSIDLIPTEKPLPLVTTINPADSDDDDDSDKDHLDDWEDMFDFNDPTNMVRAETNQPSPPVHPNMSDDDNDHIQHALIPTVDASDPVRESRLKFQKIIFDHVREKFWQGTGGQLHQTQKLVDGYQFDDTNMTVVVNNIVCKLELACLPRGQNLDLTSRPYWIGDENIAMLWITLHRALDDIWQFPGIFLMQEHLHQRDFTSFDVRTKSVNIRLAPHRVELTAIATVAAPPGNVAIRNTHALFWQEIAYAIAQFALKETHAGSNSIIFREDPTHVEVDGQRYIFKLVVYPDATNPRTLPKSALPRKADKLMNRANMFLRCLTAYRKADITNAVVWMGCDTYMIDAVLHRIELKRY